MRINGMNHYIGRSTSGSYTSSDSILSTRINTYTSNGYSVQTYTYGRNIYTNKEVSQHRYGEEVIAEWTTYTSTYPIPCDYYTYEREILQGFTAEPVYYTAFSRVDRVEQQILTSTSNAYYTTIISNGVYSTTVSTSKSVSTSSHNFV